MDEPPVLWMTLLKFYNTVVRIDIGMELASASATSRGVGQYWYPPRSSTALPGWQSSALAVAMLVCMCLCGHQQPKVPSQPDCYHILLCPGKHSAATRRAAILPALYIAAVCCWVCSLCFECCGLFLLIGGEKASCKQIRGCHLQGKCDIVQDELQITDAMFEWT